MRKLGLILLVGVLGGCSLTRVVGGGGQRACTLEAKICPDGSSVGRAGPNCEFAPCPGGDAAEGPFEARFEIYTNGVKRTFSGAMYLNQSEEVYLTAEDPSVVVVERAGVTWREFFGTLPFSLNEECLVTGLGERLCEGNGRRLVFSLNGVEGKGVLDRVIGEGDVLVVEWE